MDAINIITQALEPLDRNACERVIKWAEDRYVRLRLPGLESGDLNQVNQFMTAVGQTASRLNMNGADLLSELGKLAERLPADGEQVPG